MATMEDIMLSINAQDNASKVFQSVGSAAQASLNSMNNGMMNISNSMDNMLSSVTGKSAAESIFGTASKAETNDVLLDMMSNTSEAASKLKEHVDQTTNESLVSMQNLIPAMNAFKTATGATDDQIYNATETMASFGAKVLAQTGSVDLSEQAMMDLSKGIKGACASLDQYGITLDALKKAGWSGEEDDIEGYMKAVQELTGDTKALMETNEGLDAKLGKAFSSAGKKIGNEFLPQLKDVKQGFLDLNSATGGNLAAGILATVQGVDMLSQGASTLTQLANGARDLKSAWDAAGQGVTLLAEKFKNLTSAAEEASNAITIGGEVVQAAPTIQYAEGATDLMPDDMLGNFVEAANANISKEELTKAEKILESNDKEVLKFAKLIEKQNDSLDDAMMTLKKTGDFSKYEKDVKAINKEKENLFRYIEEFGEISSLTDGALDGIEVADDIKKSVKGAEDVGDAVKDVSKVGTTISAVGPEATSAGVAAEEAAVGFGSLSAGITSMLVPLLTIAAVVAIMIPIVTALAIEALVCLKLIQMAIDALAFDDIDLTKATEGIQQLATALGWVGVAMGAVTFTNVMTGLAVITSGFLGMTGPLSIAVDTLKQVDGKLQELSSVSISSDTPEKLKSISNSLKSVSDAMMALTALNITTGFSNFIAWALNFGSVTDGLEQAKNDILQASQKLQEFNSLTPLDETTANNIQNVCKSLASVGDAFKALTSMRDSVNWDNALGNLFGGVDIQQALSNVREDITKASAALASFTNITPIPEGVGEKVKKVSETLKSVSEAFETLRALRDNTNWDNMMGGIFKGTDIQGALQQIVTDINTAASALSGLNIGDGVNKDLIAKIKKVTDTITEVSNVASSLTSLPPMDGFDPSKITTVVGNVQTAADALKGLNIGETNDETINNIKKVASAVTEVSNVMTNLTQLPPMDGFNPESIKNAVGNVKTIATQLSGLSGTALGEDVNGVLGSINTALQTLKNTLANAGGFNEVSVNIGSQIVSGVRSGLSPLSGTVTTAVSTATNSAGSAALAGGASIATAINNGFSSTLNLHSAMETEMGYVKTAVDNGISAAKSAAESGAKDVVAAFKSGVNVGSPGDIARTMQQEMAYTYDFIKRGGSQLTSTMYSVAKNMVSSFGNPSLNVSSMLDTVGSLLSPLGALNTLSNIGSNINPAQSLNQAKTIIMNFQSGCVQVDARNKTAKEAQGLLTLALESMDNITDIQVQGG